MHIAANAAKRVGFFSTHRPKGVCRGPSAWEVRRCRSFDSPTPCHKLLRPWPSVGRADHVYETPGCRFLLGIPFHDAPVGNPRKAEHGSATKLNGIPG